MSASPIHRGRGRPRTRMLQIAKSDVLQDSETSTYNGDTVPRISNDMALSGTKIFKAVAIPWVKSGTAPEGRDTSQTPSTISSALSYDYNEYDTPDTSAAVTPAERGVETGKMRRLDKTSGLGYDTPALLSRRGKRKRRSSRDSAVQIVDDETLAQALQQEEYAQSHVLNVPASRGRKNKVLDSEDEQGDSLEISSQVNSADLPRSRASSVGANHERVKRVKIAGRTSLPSRAARDNARRSIAQKALSRFLDSDELDEEHDVDVDVDNDNDDNESALSEYYSDLDSEPEDDFDIDADDPAAGRADMADPGTLAMTSGTVSVPSRRGRRRQTHATNFTQRSTRRVRIQRRVPWLTSRVSILAPNSAVSRIIGVT